MSLLVSGGDLLSSLLANASLWFSLSSHDLLCIHFLMFTLKGSCVHFAPLQWGLSGTRRGVPASVHNFSLAVAMACVTAASSFLLENLLTYLMLLRSQSS